MKLTLTLILLLTLPAYAEVCEVESYFSPQQSIESVILQELAQAKQSVRLSVFGLTDPDLAASLIHLKQQGVDVQVTMDKLQSFNRRSKVIALRAAGIPVVIKRTSKLEHNKFAVIDSKTVVMGSWNWSESADGQDNSNVVLKNCPGQVQRFLNTWNTIKQRDMEVK